MERNFWIKDAEVMGSCQCCGAFRKYADIIRMSAEDGEAYKKASGMMSEQKPSAFTMASSSLALYLLSWIVVSLMGYTTNEAFGIVMTVVFIFSFCVLVFVIVSIVQTQRKADSVRASLLRKYGRGVKYPKDWTAWNSVFPENILILPEGVITLHSQD